MKAILHTLIRISFLFWFVCSFINATAQAPDKMSYQAVIRNAENALVVNKEVGIRISILQGTPDGTAVYSEIFTPNPVTNANGLVIIDIGTGTPLTGVFNTIDWSGGPYFIQTETDPTGGTTYTITGTNELLSVPYSLHSNTANMAAYALNVTPDIHFSAGRSSNVPIPGSLYATPIKTWSDLDQNSETSDYDATTGEYTIPVSGYYSVLSNIGWYDVYNPIANMSIWVEIRINDINYHSISKGFNAAGNFLDGLQIQIEKSFVAGDKIQIRAGQSSNQNMFLSGATNKLGIHLIHN